jgi:hypothetical protein
MVGAIFNSAHFLHFQNPPLLKVLRRKKRDYITLLNFDKRGVKEKFVMKKPNILPIFRGLRPVSVETNLFFHLRKREGRHGGR